MTAPTMRIFVPATMAALATLQRDGSLPCDTAYAVTDPYRVAVGAESAGDDEVLAYDVMIAAASASLELEDGAGRRLVLAVDAPARPDPAGVESGRVLVAGPVRLRDVASVHVDEPGAVSGDGDLLWYATQEIPDLLAE